MSSFQCHQLRGSMEERESKKRPTQIYAPLAVLECKKTFYFIGKYRYNNRELLYATEIVYANMNRNLNIHILL